MKNRRNYYRLLQVQNDAPIEIIRSSFRTLMRDLKQHPDLGGSHWEATLLNEAYETLADPARRAVYDRQSPDPFAKRSSSPTPGEQPSLSSDVHKGHAYFRSSDRMKRSEPVSYYLNATHKAEGRMIDFCPGGMLFLSCEYLPVKSVIEIRSALVEAIACVTHCIAAPGTGKGIHTVGVAFVSVRFTSPKGTLVSVTA
jgi:curved DNA-binding protein CbpA